MEQIIHVPQDLTYLSWSKVRNSSGIGGSFLKAQETTPVGKVFYKLSDYDSFRDMVVGHERNLRCGIHRREYVSPRSEGAPT